MQINNWLNAKRRKNKSNHLEKLDKWLENPSNTNIVFPTKRENFPSLYYEKEGKMIIIIHFGSQLLERFNETVIDTQIVGLDAQFVNNNLASDLCTLSVRKILSHSKQSLVLSFYLREMTNPTSLRPFLTLKIFFDRNGQAISTYIHD